MCYIMKCNFFQNTLMKINSKKKQHLIKIEIFCNNVKVFTVIFVVFNCHIVLSMYECINVCMYVCMYLFSFHIY